MSKKSIWAFAGLGVVACLAQGAPANELRFSDLEQRLSVVERQLDQQQGVRTASYYDADTAATGGGVAGAPCYGGDYCDGYAGSAGVYYAEVQLMWMRPHVHELWVGKLSEDHHLAPRYILGYEDCSGLGTRVRYWNFDHAIDVRNRAIIDLNVETVDLEVTNRICFRSTDVVLGGGFRYANWEIGSNRAEVNLDAYGLTMAADARTPLFVTSNGQWSVVYGGRVSILGGDWHGDNDILNTVGPRQVRDDNLLVTELNTGLEYMFCYAGYDLFIRGVVEMQNWRSDVVALTGTDSIGFVGYGVHVGAAF